MAIQEIRYFFGAATLPQINSMIENFNQRVATAETERGVSFKNYVVARKGVGFKGDGTVALWPLVREDSEPAEGELNMNDAQGILSGLAAQEHLIWQKSY